MQKLHDLFNQTQLDAIEGAPLYMMSRHPTWFPLYGPKPRTIDILVHEAVSRINLQANGQRWLQDLVPRLIDQLDISNAASALAEIRAYGGLLKAGFDVTPIPRCNDVTPDFNINAGDGQVIVEVFAKQQDKEQDNLMTVIHSSDEELPSSVERRVHQTKKHKVVTTVFESTPGGRPDPDKPNDSALANMISRICAIKQNEIQIPKDKPVLLIMDFANFGGPHISEFLKADTAAPIEKGVLGFISGSFWYAMYGWKNAPIFEGVSFEINKMGHDGRFRLSGKRKSKLSAVLVTFTDGAVLLENPWAIHRLPDQTRLNLCNFPFFDFSRSIADWHQGDLVQKIDAHCRTIEAIEKFISFNNLDDE